MVTTTPSSITVPRRAKPRLEELFDAWVLAAHDAAAALQAWIETLPRDRAGAHTVYRAALDREESAAEALMVASRRNR
jgi:hypothetical protein